MDSLLGIVDQVPFVFGISDDPPSYANPLMIESLKELNRGESILRTAEQLSEEPSRP
jgi:hypothetical protein